MNIIDTHVDTITYIMDKNEGLLKNNANVSLEDFSIFDKKGIYFAIWLSQNKKHNAFSETMKAIEYYYKEINTNKTLIKHSNTFKEFKTAFDEKLLASLLCIEGGESLEGNLDNLYKFHEIGVRLLTLTWNNENEFASGVLGKNTGLTSLGKDLIREVNKIDFGIDISHLNEKGFYDVINLTQKPIIATHSNSYDICNSKRNLSNDQLIALKSINSYVSLTIHSPFVNGTENCSISDLLFHIDKLLNILGENFISIGTDFDGSSFLPNEIKTISDIRSLYNIVEKTYNTVIANKIFYKNQLRFLRQII